MTVAALAGGTLAGTAHLAKAGTRALINLSPEPVSNVVTSTAEDGLVFGGLLLALFVPLLFLVLMIGLPDAGRLGVAAALARRAGRLSRDGDAHGVASCQEQARLSDTVRGPRRAPTQRPRAGSRQGSAAPGHPHDGARLARGRTDDAAARAGAGRRGVVECRLSRRPPASGPRARCAAHDRRRFHRARRSSGRSAIRRAGQSARFEHRQHGHLPQHDQFDRRAAGLAPRRDQGGVAGLSAARRGADRAGARRAGPSRAVDSGARHRVGRSGVARRAEGARRRHGESRQSQLHDRRADHA